MLVCTYIYENGTIHRALHQLFQAEWWAFPHQIGEKRRVWVTGTYPALPPLSLKGVGDQLAWVDFKGKGGKKRSGGLILLIYIHCIMYHWEIKKKLNQKEKRASLAGCQHKKPFSKVINRFSRSNSSFYIFEVEKNKHIATLKNRHYMSCWLKTFKKHFCQP